MEVAAYLEKIQVAGAQRVWEIKGPVDAIISLKNDYDSLLRIVDSIDFAEA